jgi:uncharacterized membrane protein YfcA
MTLIIAAAAFAASLLTLFSGFGLGTLLMPVVAIFFPVAVAVALTAFVHLLNNLFKLLVLWKMVNWRVAFRFGFPAMIATVPGAWLLTTLSVLPELHSYMIAGHEAVVTPVKLAVGILLVFFATAEWFSLGEHFKVSVRWLPAGGVLSGFFGGLSGHQGAFRSAFLIRAGLDKNAFVATNAVIAAAVDLARLTVYGLNMGLLLAHANAGLLIAATVAAFAGVLAGQIGLKKVTIGFIQKLVAVMLYALGLLLIAGII